MMNLKGTYALYEPVIKKTWTWSVSPYKIWLALLPFFFSLESFDKHKYAKLMTQRVVIFKKKQNKMIGVTLICKICNPQMHRVCFKRKPNQFLICITQQQFM